MKYFKKELKDEVRERFIEELLLEISLNPEIRVDREKMRIVLEKNSLIDKIVGNISRKLYEELDTSAS